MTHLNTLRILLLLAIFFCLPITQSFAVDYYWRGGAGNWSDINHWYNAAGDKYSQVPGVNDDVYFNENSGFTSNSKQVTINTEATCRNISFKNCVVAPTLSFAKNINIYGSLELQSGMTTNGSSMLYFRSSNTGNTITTNGVKFFMSINFEGSGDWTLLDDFLMNYGWTGPILTVNQGKLIMDSQNVTALNFIVKNKAEISMVNSTLNLYRWEYVSSIGLSSSATHGSTIKFKFDLHRNVSPLFITKTASDTYYNVEVYTTRDYDIQGGTFNRISFKGAMGTLGTAFPIVTKELELHASGKCTLAKDITITDKLSILPRMSTGCGGFVELFSSQPGTMRTITYGGAADNVVAECVSIQDVKIEGSESAYPATGIDGGNHADTWDFSPVAEKTLYWIGGAGDWNDGSHWSLNSGDVAANCIPTAFDNVIFDNNSGFTGTGQEVSITQGAFAHDLSFKGTQNPPKIMMWTRLNIYGSLTLQSGMEIERLEEYSSSDAAIWFRSNDEKETITSNGVQLGSLPCYFASLNETGAWALQDDFKHKIGTGGIIHQSGHLNFNGKAVSTYRFYSTGNNGEYKSSRSLNIAGSTIELTAISSNWTEAGWIYNGGQALTAEQTVGSKIIVNTVGVTFFKGKRDDVYDELECIGSGIGHSGAYGEISGGKHRKVTIASNFARLGFFTTDILLFTSSGEYIYATSTPVTVNENFSSTQCGGNISLYSNVAGTQRTIAIKSGATVDLSNMTLTDMKITGNTPYVINNSVDNGNNTGWSFETSATNTYYWVGSSGNWSDPMHWATESGGDPNGNCIPGVGDNVIFDDKSFSAPEQTVTLDGGAYCNTMRWVGSESLKPEFAMGSNSVFINGSLELQKGMEITSDGIGYGDMAKSFTFISSNQDNTITSNGIEIPVHVIFKGVGGWQLADEFKQKRISKSAVYFTNGHLDFNGQIATLNGFNSIGGNTTRTLNIANSEIRINGYVMEPWIYTGGVPLTASNTENSTIKIIFPKNGENKTEFTCKLGDVYYNLESIKDDLKLTNGIFNKVTLNARSVINNIETNTLIFKPGLTYQFTAGATSTINEAWYASGNNCHVTTIQSTSPGTQATVKVMKAAANMKVPDTETENNVLSLDFIRVRDINVPVDADLYAIPRKGPRSTNDEGYGSSGNNSANWIMEDEVDKQNFGELALGGPVTISCDNFPYTISTAGMAPTPYSTFRWYKGSISQANYIGNGSEWKVMSAGDAGTYYCVVDYAGDGECQLDASKKITATDASYLVWNGSAGDQDWHNPANWELTKGDKNNPDNVVPSRCISVLIPDGIDNYPDLEKTSTHAIQDEIACDIITFEHGGEVLRTDLLDYYTRANVELNLPANQWHMLSAPLHNMYTGDVYVSDPAPLADGYFMEQMMFNASNPQTGVPASYTWTGRFNTADIEFQPGQGFALWIDKHGTEYTDHPATSMMFPKLDTYYNYFLYDGTVTGKTKTLDRSKNGRFIHEGNLSDDTALEMTLTASVNDATGENAPVLVGNPFMAHLNFKEFAARNSSLIGNQFKLAYDIASVDGKMNTFASCIWDAETSKYITTITGLDVDNPAIAPMQSFVVIPQTANPTIKASILETNLLPGDKLRSSSEVPAMLSVVAERAGESVKTLLLHRNYADNTYVPAEDSYTLFPESNLDPVFVYTRSNDGYALDINAFGNYSELIPLGIRTAKQGEITLSFDGMNSFDRTDIYLIDTYNNSRTNLSEVDSYTFNKGDGNLYLEDRFFLSFISRGTTGMDDMTSRISISNVGQELHILNPSGEAFEVTIYNTSGQCILRESGEGIKTVIPTNLNNGGVYVAKVVSEQDAVTKTIIIK